MAANAPSPGFPSSKPTGGGTPTDSPKAPTPALDPILQMVMMGGPMAGEEQDLVTGEMQSQPRSQETLWDLINRVGEESMQQVVEELKQQQNHPVRKFTAPAWVQPASAADYHEELRATKPKREDYPDATDDEWEEIMAGYYHRVGRILGPRPRR